MKSTASTFTLLLLLTTIASCNQNPISESGNIDVCMLPDVSCEEKLISELQNSSSIKAALYDLSHEGIMAALRGRSQILVYSENYRGIGTKVYNQEGLMHNKFYVLETGNGKKLITGSANPTIGDIEKSRNNVLYISSKTLSNNYEEEFYEILLGKPNKKTKNTTVNLSGTLILNYFCPEDDCEHRALEELEQAKATVHFMTYSFTSDKIGTELTKTKASVKGMFDPSQAKGQKELSEYYTLKSAGREVYLYSGSGKLHHKVFIIDSETVITGSYNPTSNGNERNDENLLVIKDKSVAALYEQEFDELLKEVEAIPK